MEQDKIIIYRTKDGRTQVDVRLEKDTVWLTANQMALLFDREESNVRRHIINVFKEGELERENNVHFLHVNGVKKPVPFYNLDVIISVGYRVNSKKGIIFRKWASNILKNYLVEGYVVNEKRLSYLEKQINLISIASRLDEKLILDEGNKILETIINYKKALSLLDDYDHQTLIEVQAYERSKS